MGGVTGGTAGTHRHSVEGDQTAPQPAQNHFALRCFWLPADLREDEQSPMAEHAK